MNPTSLSIIYAGPFRFPLGDAAAARVLNNARALRLAGHRVEFLSYGGYCRPEDATPEGYSFEGFRYSVTNDIDRSGENTFRRVVNFLLQGSGAFKQLKKIKQPDVVIVYNPALVMTLRMLTWTRSRPVRFVADLTECYHYSEFPGGKWMPFAWMNELNIRWALRLIPTKLVISSYINRLYHSSDNLIVPPLVDTREEKWTRRTDRIPAFEGISCIYAGTPSGKDQVLFLLEALRQAIANGARIRLIFLGDEMEVLHKLVQSPEMQSCRDYVLFAGKVPQQEVPACYAAADFSLLFREQNRKNNAGFPTKFVESMAAGVPVIGNLTSDIGGYLQHQYNGFIVKSIDAGLLADLFCELTSLSKLQLSNLKSAARETAVQHFDYRNHQEKLNQFINSIR